MDINNMEEILKLLRERINTEFSYYDYLGADILGEDLYNTHCPIPPFLEDAMGLNEGALNRPETLAKYLISTGYASYVVAIPRISKWQRLSIDMEVANFIDFFRLCYSTSYYEYTVEQYKQAGFPIFKE